MRHPSDPRASARAVTAMRSVVAVAALTIGGCGDRAEDAVETRANDDLVIADVGFATPESVIHDEIADVYLVSNISGDPFAKDGDGFISRLAPDGSVLALRWIDSSRTSTRLDAPKGLALTAEHLWVADIDTLRRFDRQTGEFAGSVPIEGSTFLNDVTVGPDGELYVTDSGFGPGFEPNGSDAIWRVAADLSVRALCQDPTLGNPNGIAYGNVDLFAVSWTTGEFALVGEKGPMAPVKLPTAQLDGLVRTPDGRWLISSWAGRCVYELAPNGTATVVVAEVDTPADIGFDGTRMRILIPSFSSDRVIVRRLPEK